MFLGKDKELLGHLAEVFSNYDEALRNDGLVPAEAIFLGVEFDEAEFTKYKEGKLAEAKIIYAQGVVEIQIREISLASLMTEAGHA